METKEYLKEELAYIEKWESDQKGLWFWEKLMRLPFKFLDKITPAFIQKKIGLLLDELGSYLQTGGNYLSKESDIFSFYNKNTSKSINSIEEMRLEPIRQVKEVALLIKENRKNTATIQEASTGIGGIFTLALDIPAILAISFKTLQDIAILHGYNPKDKKERVFILKCLQFSTSDIVGKEAILKELAQFDDLQREESDMFSKIQGWREVSVNFTESFGWKKLFQMVPIAGILFGAYANRTMIHDLAEVGTMLYQKRRILERLDQLDSDDYK